MADIDDSINELNSKISDISKQINNLSKKINDTSSAFTNMDKLVNNASLSLSAKLRNLSDSVGSPTALKMLSTHVQNANKKLQQYNNIISSSTQRITQLNTTQQQTQSRVRQLNEAVQRHTTQLQNATSTQRGPIQRFLLQAQQDLATQLTEEARLSQRILQEQQRNMNLQSKQIL